MKRVYAKHLPYENGHLGEVCNLMMWAREPTLRCIKRDSSYFLLEGSHRIASCDYLGLTPKLVILQEDLGDTLDEFWNNLEHTLPCYEFKEVLELDLRYD